MLMLMARGDNCGSLESWAPSDPLSAGQSIIPIYTLILTYCCVLVFQLRSSLLKDTQELTKKTMLEDADVRKRIHLLHTSRLACLHQS